MHANRVRSRKAVPCHREGEPHDANDGDNVRVVVEAASHLRGVLDPASLRAFGHRAGGAQ